MPDFNVVSFVGTIISILYLGLILFKFVQLMDAGTTYLKSRTEIEREKFNHDRINGWRS